MADIGVNVDEPAASSPPVSDTGSVLRHRIDARGAKPDAVPFLLEARKRR